MPFRHSARRHSPGFSLIELLVVLAIVGVLATLAIPAVTSMTRGYQLNATSDLVINQLALARQAALSNSRLVQVRFYHLPDYGQAPTGNKTVYRAIQSFIEGDPSATGSLTLTPVTKTVFFPAPAIVSTLTTPNISPLLSTLPVNATVSDPSTATSSDPVVPTYGSNYDYFWFHFKPDGSTDLASGGNSLTIIMENDPSATSGLPHNYRTIQIDPAIGTARRFSP
jgi:uncharacterized protein (TIGR02596 family)